MEGPFLRLQRPDGGQEDFLHALCRNLRRVLRRGRDGPHAAGVGALVAVVGPLVVLAGGHGGHVLPVGKSQHGDLRPGHALFDDHGGAGFAELFVLHHLPDSGFGLIHGGGHHHALPQSQPVRLHHDGRALLLNVGQGLVQVGEGLVLGGGDVVLFHQLLGEGLAGLDDGGAGPGAESGYARFLQGVHHAQGQGVVGGHHHEIHGVFLGPPHHADHVGGLYVHTLSELGDARVAGGAVQLGDLVGLLQFPTNGMFSATRSNH